MYMLAKYEIHDWVKEYHHTYRVIIDKTKNSKEYDSHMRIIIWHDGKDKEIVKAIWFKNNIFGKEHMMMYGWKEDIPKFNSIQEAKDHIDEFLGKLQKLIVFI